MQINFLYQTRRTNCGQTAVAMLTGKSIAEIERVYGHVHSSYSAETARIVNKLGFYGDERGFIPHQGGKLPELALVRVVTLKRTRHGYSSSGKTRRNGHLVLWANGKFYDPYWGELSELPVGRKIDTVLEVLAP